MRKNTLQVAILNAILLMGGAMAYPATAYAQGQAQTYSIAGGDLESVLSRFGTESRIQLIYPPELLKGKRSSGLTGSHTPTEALRLLLEGSGLVAERVNDKTVVIKKAVAAPAAEPQVKSNDASKAAQVAEPEVKELSAMTVTGTRIRGGTTPSPMITIGSEQIEEEGFADLGEVIRSVPQNFRGGQNPGVLGGVTGIANQNITGGSGLNLRGLGPDATLTLLNGRRMSYGGFVQAIDISAIPIEAVDRIDIVADGASAIYGSDAVAGVGNVILERDFEGVTIGTRYGTAMDGGLATRDYSITAGATWPTGGLIVTYKDVSADPIYAHQRDYTDHLGEPRTIYFGNDLRSGLLSAHQSLGESVELRLDALRTERETLSYTGSSATYYMHYPNETITALLSPSAEFSLPGDWTLSAGATWGKDETTILYDRVDRSAQQSTITQDQCQCNESRSYEVGAEGPLFSLPDGDVRLAIGVGYRKNEYAQANHLTAKIETYGEESVRFAYAEISMPLIGPEQDVRGVHRLEATAAVRGEDYDSFGGVTTPKFGFIYGPNADFTLKASWGKSFKAPTLMQRYQAAMAYINPISWYNGTGYPADATIMLLWGGDVDLRPERARTWSASLAFHPESLPGLETELTWFDIDYSDRVVQPLASYWLTLHDPTYAEFITYSPTAQQLAELTSVLPIVDSSGEGYDPNNVYAILHNRYTNATRQRVRGLDLSGSYRFDMGTGRLTVRGSGSWLDISQKTTQGESAFDLSGTLFNPAEIGGRLGAIWDRGGFTASAFANYTSGVYVSSTISAVKRKTASFTTFNATLRYATGERGGAWSGIEIALAAQNVFDRAPPLYAPISATDPPYDSLNYSAIGRFLSVSVSKHW